MRLPRWRCCFLPPHGLASPGRIPSNRRAVSAVAFLTLFEWHVLASYFLLLSILYAPLALVSAAMWSMTFAAVVRAGWTARLGASRWWSRPLVGALQLLQPIVRSAHRWKQRLLCRPRPTLPGAADCFRCRPKRIGPDCFDFYWTSADGRGRELLLDRAVNTAHEAGWPGDFHCNWDAHDLMLMGDNWHRVEIRTATEELGDGNRFTRARARLRPTRCTGLSAFAVGLWAILGCWRGGPIALSAVAVCAALLLTRLLLSRRNCRNAVGRLLAKSGASAGLVPLDTTQDSALKAQSIRSTAGLVQAATAVSLMQPEVIDA